MDYFSLLLDCGLTKKEASTYLALWQRGDMTLSKISHHTHINRPALYHVLPALLEKGLVTERTQGKRTLYRAETPERIESLLIERQRKVSVGLQKLVAERAEQKNNRPIVQFFEGPHATTFVFDDIALAVPRGGLYYRYSSKVSPNSEGFENSTYYRLRESKQIERMVITSEEKLARKEQKLNRHIKAIPNSLDLFEDNISLLIYGNKTAYIDYESMTSIVIESPKIARFQEKLFKALYRFLPTKEK